MRVVDRTVYERLSKHLGQLYGEEEVPRILSRIDLLVGRYGVGTCKDERCGDALWDQRDAVLIAYGDTVRNEGEAPLRTLLHFLEHRLGDAISAVHLLPFFPSSSDDGFSITDYRQVDPAIGRWEDIRSFSARYRLMVDLIVNHVSGRSRWFRNFSNGIAPERHYFIEVEPGTDLSAVNRPRNSPLLRSVQTPSGERLVWTTFSPDQVDLDFRNPDVLFEFLDVLLFYVHHGARILRLDAIAYLWKEIGTSCLDLDENHKVIVILRDLLELLAPGIILAAETSLPHHQSVRYFGAGDEAHVVYQFCLPALLLHALETGDARYLASWLTGLQAPPPGCTFFNFTASHDGIGIGHLGELLPPEDIEALVERTEQKGGYVTRLQNPDGSETPVELNITYFDALSTSEGHDDLGTARFLCSQIIMLSLRGIPGIYFNSLVGAPNWLAGVEETGQARTLNRKKWGLLELENLIQNPTGPANHILAEYQRLLGIRRQHPAFHPDAPQRPLELPSGLLGFERAAPDGSETIRVVANMTSAAREIETEVIDGRMEHRRISELIQGWSAPGAELVRLDLAPYQVMWLAG